MKPKLCANATRAESKEHLLAPFPQVLMCLDPDHCEGDTCDIPWQEPAHHYGCECSVCMMWYKSLK